MTIKTVSENLLRLRIEQGLSQEELAKKSGLSNTAYKKIEAGNSEPKVLTLQNIANALNTDIGTLLTPVREMSSVRFRSHKKMNKRSVILANVANWLDNYTFVEELIQESKKPFLFQSIIDNSTDSGKTDTSSEDFAKGLAIEVRRKLHDEKHLGKKDEPINNICGLLEVSGIKVYTLDVSTDSFFGLSVGFEDGGPAIVVNDWDRISVERKIFTAAHELGHLLMHSNSYNPNNEDFDPTEERGATVFAGYFLMPEKAFNHRLDEYRGLSFYDMVIKLKRHFKVSYQTILVRLSNDKDHWYELMEDFSAAYEQKTGKKLTRKDEAEPLLSKDDFKAKKPVPKKAQEPVNLDDYDFDETRLDKLVRESLLNDKISLSRASEILNIELSEMKSRLNSWKRINYKGNLQMV